MTHTYITRNMDNTLRFREERITFSEKRGSYVIY